LCALSTVVRICDTVPCVSGAPRNCAIWRTPEDESNKRNSRPAAAKEKIAKTCSMLNAGLGPVACGSKQQPALQSLERILSGLMRWSRLSNPGSSMQVRCKWLLEACMSKDDLDHTFRIQELRGMSQYRRTLLLRALLMLRKYGCNAPAFASDGSIATLTRCASRVEAGWRSVGFSFACESADMQGCTGWPTKLAGARRQLQ
jgi:hypothetical protein